MQVRANQVRAAQEVLLRDVIGLLLRLYARDRDTACVARRVDRRSLRARDTHASEGAE